MTPPDAAAPCVTASVDYFPAAVQIVLEDEGAFSDDKQDPGGKTKYGISQLAYPTLDIANLTVAQAKTIYLIDYWRRAGCDRLPWRWALPVFDCAVNQGAEEAVDLLQQALNLKVDGLVGKVTIAAAVAAGDDTIDLFMALRGVRYAQDKKFARYGKGWLRRTYQVLRLSDKEPAPVQA